MAETKIFSLMKRFNVLVIMASGLFVLGLLSYALIPQITRKIELRKPDSVAKRSPKAENESEPKLQIDRYLEVRGTPYLIFPLKSGETYRRDSYLDSSSSGSKATYSLSRNYLFVDIKNEGQQWLLPDNKNLIIRDRLIPSSADKTLPTQAILYTLVTQDTDGDKTLSTKDKLTLGISKPDGKQYREIVSGVSRLLGYQEIDESRGTIIYEKEAAIYSQAIDLDLNTDVLSDPTLIYQNK